MNNISLKRALALHWTNYNLKRERGAGTRNWKICVSEGLVILLSLLITLMIQCTNAKPIQTQITFDFYVKVDLSSAKCSHC